MKLVGNGMTITEKPENLDDAVRLEDINTFIIGGITQNIYSVNSNEYAVYQIPLIKKMQKGNDKAFSIIDNELVIGENVALVKITQNFIGEITNSFCVNTQKNNAVINELRDYNASNNGTNKQRTTSITAFVEAKAGDRLKMVLWSTSGNISSGVIQMESTSLIVEKIA